MARQIVLVAALLVLGVVDGTFAAQLSPKVDPIIAGGWAASPGDLPYQVSLRNHDNHFCGGSLISNQYVLTAAHCIVGLVEPPFIGITAVTGTISLSEGEYHRIKDVVVHPNYANDMKKSYKNDIAIITLETPISPNAYQRPIRVAFYNPPKSALLMLSGWGLTSVHGELSPTLQKKTVYSLSNKLCQLYYGRQPIFDTHLCTLSLTGKVACPGDGGDPLTYNDEVVGIASFVNSCAQGLPDVYTSVSHYLDFINSTIKT